MFTPTLPPSSAEADEAHPFVVAFHQAPAQTVDRAVRAVLWLPNIGRIDVTATLARLFRTLPADDAFAQQFDGCLCDWLVGRLSLTRSDNVSYGGDRTVALDLCRAFELVEQLPLPQCRATLRDKKLRIRMSGWCWDLMENANLDPHHDFWAALTQDQIDFSLTQWWISFAQRAGRDDLPDRYLSLALQGRRHQPWPTEEARARALLGVLVHWAAGRSAEAQADAQRLVARRCNALRWGDPFTPDVWRRLQADALADCPKAPDWLKAVWAPPPVKTKTPSPGRRNDGRTQGRVGLAFIDFKALSRDIDAPRKRDTTLRTAEEGLNRRLRWAEEKGDGFPLGEMVGGVAKALRRHAPEQLADWARRAVEWGLENKKVWNVWALGLANSGRRQDALAVAVEAARRFPGDEHSQVTLGQILWAQGRIEDGFSLLQAAAETFTDRPAAQLEYALGMWDRGQTGESLARLRADAARFTENKYIQTEYARHLAASGDLSGAVSQLHAFVQRHPDTVVARTNLGLYALNMGDLATAQEQLTALQAMRETDIDRSVAQLERALAAFDPRQLKPPQKLTYDPGKRLGLTRDACDGGPTDDPLLAQLRQTQEASLAILLPNATGRLADLRKTAPDDADLAVRYAAYSGDMAALAAYAQTPAVLFVKAAVGHDAAALAALRQRDDGASRILAALAQADDVGQLDRNTLRRVRLGRRVIALIDDCKMSLPALLLRCLPSSNDDLFPDHQPIAA